MPNSPFLKKDDPQCLIDDIIESILEGWSGLRYYIRQRRAGRPADPTMDTLLSELLRVNLGRRADIPRVVEHLIHPQAH